MGTVLSIRGYLILSCLFHQLHHGTNAIKLLVSRKATYFFLPFPFLLICCSGTLTLPSTTSSPCACNSLTFS